MRIDLDVTVGLGHLFVYLNYCIIKYHFMKINLLLQVICNTEVRTRTKYRSWSKESVCKNFQQ